MLAGVKGFLIDLDGTVYEDDGLLPGVSSALAALSAAGLPIRFGTNTTRMGSADVRRFLGGMGLDIPPGALLTAPLAAAGLLRGRGIQRIALHVPEITFADFAEFEIDESHPEAVVVGDLGSGWTFERLNTAFRQVLAGAELIGLQRNRYWKTRGRLTLDAGPILAALEYATGARAIIAGKPSADFFAEAARSMGIPLAAMAVVGDDLRADVQGSTDCGALGVLVRTGKFRPEDLDAPDARPTAVVDSLADVPRLVGVETA